ncbi:hypothetical protein [Vibrio owensii]|uniref:hypothetical protein n=1 Tax=Vibrio owensii TaxID=696485 RepID=UPI003DA1A54A
MKRLLLSLLLTSTSALSESTLNKSTNAISETKRNPVSGQIVFKGKVVQEPCTLNLRIPLVGNEKKSKGCVEYTTEKIDIIDENTVKSSSILIVNYI